MLAVLSGLAVLSFERSDGDFGEGVWKFTVLVSLFGLLALYTVRERRTRGRAYEARWRSICHVLDVEHSHEGAMLRGTWKGKPFRAYATAFIAGQYAGTVSEYSVAMPVEHSAPAWKAERADGSTAFGGTHLWTVRGDVWSAEERLVEAGLLTAIQEAERSAVHFGPSTRLSFRPRMTEVTYEDASGEPPCAEDLVVHLDLLRRAVDVHAAIVSYTGQPEGGPRLRIEDPPLWLAGLWLPAAFVVPVVGSRWPWAFALFPVALAAPYLWRLQLPRAARRGRSWRSNRRLTRPSRGRRR